MSITCEESELKSKSVFLGSKRTSIADEEFYRILQELHGATENEDIDQISLLWERSLKIGWEGDIVRNAIRDAIYYLCRKYGIKKHITYEKVLRRQARYRFLKTCREGEPRDLSEYEPLMTKDYALGMIGAIENGNVNNVAWFIANHFRLPSESHLICAIKVRQMLIAKDLLQHFVPKTEESRENVCMVSIEYGWYLGCVGITKKGSVDYSKMVVHALEFNQLAIAQFFQRKGGKIPSNFIVKAVEKNHQEVVSYLLKIRNQEVESAIIRCLDFPDHTEIIKLLLADKKKTFNTLRLLSLERNTPKLQQLKSIVVSLK